MAIYLQVKGRGCEFLTEMQCKNICLYINHFQGDENQHFIQQLACLGLPSELLSLGDIYSKITSFPLSL